MIGKVFVRKVYKYFASQKLKGTPIPSRSVPVNAQFVIPRPGMKPSRCSLPMSSSMDSSSLDVSVNSTTEVLSAKLH